jgi:hypothetical protein
MNTGETSQVEVNSNVDPMQFADQFFGTPSLSENGFVQSENNFTQAGTENGIDEGKNQFQNLVAPAAKVEAPSSSSLKEMIGKRYSDLQLDDNADEETIFKALEERFRPQLHPVAARIQHALQQGQNIEEAIGSLTRHDRLLQMDDENLVALAYQNEYGRSENRPHGMDQDAIVSQIKSMANNGTLRLQAIKLRDSILAQKQKEEEAFQSYQPQDQTPDWSDPNTRKEFVQKVIDPSINNLISSKAKIPGVDWAKPDHINTIKAEMMEFMTPTKELNNLSPFAKDVQDNLAQVALVWKLFKSGAFSAHQQRGKEEAKDSFLKQLGMIPPTSQQQPKPSDAEAADILAAFSTNTPLR